MVHSIPKDELYKYSFRFSVLIMLTAFVSTYIMGSGIGLVVFRTVAAFIHFFVIFAINIELYQYLHRNNIKCKKRYKIFLGILLTSIFLSLTTGLSQFLVYSGWLPSSINDLKIIGVIYSWKLFLFIPFLSLVMYSTVYFFHNFIILAYNSKKAELEVARLQNANAETTNHY